MNDNIIIKCQEKIKEIKPLLPLLNVKVNFESKNETSPLVQLSEKINELEAICNNPWPAMKIIRNPELKKMYSSYKLMKFGEITAYLNNTKSLERATSRFMDLIRFHLLLTEKNLNVISNSDPITLDLPSKKILNIILFLLSISRGYDIVDTVVKTPAEIEEVGIKLITFEEDDKLSKWEKFKRFMTEEK